MKRVDEMSLTHYLFMLKESPAIIFLILLVITLPVFGDTNIERDAWERYALGLELLIDEKTDEGLLVLEGVISDYPNTAASKKAEEYVEKYSTRLDRSGIVSFYLGTMISTTWAVYSIPMILDIEDGIVMGSAGIIGVGSGIYAAWLMSRNIDMGLGKDLWIEFIESAAVTNFQYAYSIFGDNIDDSDLREKINIGGQSVTSLASRGLTYKYIINRDPSAGRVFTVINTYAWSQYYLWIALSEIFNSENDNLNYSLGIIIPDLAALGSYYLWDRAGWSFQRTGIISVSGFGGLLIGMFTNMIVAEAGNFDPSDALTSYIILGGSLAGKIIGVYATANMDPDDKADESLFTNISFAPLVSQNGTGFMMNLHF